MKRPIVHLLLSTTLLALPLAMPPLAGWAADRHEGADYWQSVTVLNVSGEAHRSVTPDKLTATVVIEHEAKDAATAQAYVNEKMKLAKVAAGDVPGVKFETGSYNTYQVSQGDKQKTTVWHARQDVTLSGGKPESLTKLVAQLQGMGFAVNGLSYELSREKADQVRGELINEALDDVKAKAQKIADHLGYKSVRYAVINTDNGGGVVRPMYARAMTMKAEAAAMPEPVATPGSTEVQVSVSAEVHLR
jgi:predicted secreted protein